MEFVIIATVVLVLAMCLGADFVIVPIMSIVFLVVLLLVIFGFFVYSAVKLTGTKSVKGKFVRSAGQRARNLIQRFTRLVIVSIQTYSHMR